MRAGKFNIRPGFFLLLAVFLTLDYENLCLYILLAAFLHELAHYLLIRFYGGRVREVILSASGAEMRKEHGRVISYAAEILIALSGPVVNLLIALIFSLYGTLTGSESAYLFAGINLTLGLLNLLPAHGFDGGRALVFFFEWAFDESYAPRVLSICISVLLIGLGTFVLLVTGQNLTMLAAGLWVLLRPFPPGLEKRAGSGYNI